MTDFDCMFDVSTGWKKCLCENKERAMVVGFGPSFVTVIVMDALHITALHMQKRWRR